MKALPPANNDNEDEEKNVAENADDLNIFDPSRWTNADKEAEIDAKIAHAEETLKKFDFIKLNEYQYDFLDEATFSEWLKPENAIAEDPFDQSIKEKPLYQLDQDEMEQLKNERAKDAEFNQLIAKAEKDFKSTVFDKGMRMSRVVPCFENEPGKFKLVIVESGLIENDVDGVEVSVFEYGRLLEKVLMVKDMVGTRCNFQNISYIIDEQTGPEESIKEMVGKIILTPGHPEFRLYAGTVWHINITQILKTKPGYRPGTFIVSLQAYVTDVKEYSYKK